VLVKVIKNNYCYIRSIINHQSNHNMKQLYALALLCFSFTYAQETAVTSWINQNAITIEDAGQETPLTNLKNSKSKIFRNVRLFGFGEATHYTKEFFDLKAKFFKHLVENEGVTLFMMEDVYVNSADVNRFIAGGEGDARQMAGNLGFSIWHNEEIMNLLQWMCTYNNGKPADKQVKFYAIDCQLWNNTNIVIKRFIEKYNVKTQEGTTVFLDSCTQSKFSDKKLASIKLTSNLKQFEVLKNDLKSNFIPKDAVQTADFNEALYALNVLNGCTKFLLKQDQDTRDKIMADNVSWLLQHYSEASKGFIWAHNGHIAKHDDKFYRMGIHLKATYGDAYYSMGFSYAKGKLIGMTKKDKKNVWLTYDLNEPVKKTYAEVLNTANASLYIINFKDALQNTAMKTFLNSRLLIIDEGSGGHYPGYKGKKEKLAELYDGIIFVKDVSVPVYIKDSVTANMIVD
jgi:erythromycin esterase